MTRTLGWLSARDSDLPHGQLALNSSVLNLIISFSLRKKKCLYIHGPFVGRTSLPHANRLS